MIFCFLCEQNTLLLCETFIEIQLVSEDLEVLMVIMGSESQACLQAFYGGSWETSREVLFVIPRENKKVPWLLCAGALSFAGARMVNFWCIVFLIKYVSNRENPNFFDKFPSNVYSQYSKKLYERAIFKIATKFLVRGWIGDTWRVNLL